MFSLTKLGSKVEDRVDSKELIRLVIFCQLRYPSVIISLIKNFAKKEKTEARKLNFWNKAAL